MFFKLGVMSGKACSNHGLTRVSRYSLSAAADFKPSAIRLFLYAALLRARVYGSPNAIALVPTAARSISYSSEDNPAMWSANILPAV